MTLLGVKNLIRKSVLIIIMALLSVSFSVIAQDDEDYTIPDNPEGADPTTVVATVGDRELTLQDFFERVRYERFFRFDLLNTVVDQAGEQVLVLDDPANQLAPQIAQFLEQIANSQNFGQEVYRTMILEQLYLYEAEQRGLEATECELNQAWTSVLNFQVDPQQAQTDPCDFPPEFEERKSSYIEQAQIYSGMSEEDVTDTVRALASSDLVYAELGEEVEFEDVQTIRTSHIRVSDAETAQAARAALDEGGSWFETLVTYTEDTGVVGNGGQLPPFSRGETVPEFEEAMFGAPVGEITGPVQTQFGYHIIEVQEELTGIAVRHILFDNIDDANAAVGILQDDPDAFPDLAQLYSIDGTTANTGGELGYLTEQNTQMPPEFNEAVFAAEVGEIVGPIETQRGWHVAEVTEAGEEPVQIRARHILVEDLELAEALLVRLEEGEDFANLANEFSIDGGGNRGDTLSILSQGQQQGAYTLEQMFAQLPDLAVNLANVEEGDIIGPIQTQFGFFIVRVEELASRAPTEQERQIAIDEYVGEWQVEQLEGELIEDTDIWRQFMVFDPMPSAIDPVLEDLDVFIERSRADAEERRIANSIPNILAGLQLPEVAPEPEMAPEAESTPEAEVTEEASD